MSERRSISLTEPLLLSPSPSRRYAATVQGFELNTFRHRMRYDDGVVEIVNLLKEEWRPAPEIGSHIEIFWQDDNIWYTVEVRDFDEESSTHLLHYVDDGYEDFADLRFEMWQPCAKPHRRYPGAGQHMQQVAAAQHYPQQPHPASRPKVEHATPNRASSREPSASARAAQVDYSAGLGGGHNGQIPVAENLTSLITHVEHLGGDRSLLEGWTCLRKRAASNAIPSCKSLLGGAHPHLLTARAPSTNARACPLGPRPPCCQATSAA